MSVTIIKPGMHSTLQNLGRWGLQAFGIPIGGAMNTESAMTANRLCGNEDDALVVESTLHGLVMEFNDLTVLAITGGGCRLLINGEAAPFNRLIKVIAGSQLKTIPSEKGCRCYVATPGGWKGNTGDVLSASYILSSEATPSTDAAAAIVIGASGFGTGNWKAPEKELPDVHATTTIEIIKGPEWDRFTEDAHHAFLNEPFTVSANSDRMGYRLNGPSLHVIHTQELISTPVTRGIIQVTHEGDPIVLMADAQTIGGYPRIARVSSKDLPLLAQCRPGSRIKFANFFVDIPHPFLGVRM